jgi:lycopene cyclase domain-containing protein
MTYLVVDLATISLPLLFSFNTRLRFYRHWRSFWQACALTVPLFGVWDALFVRFGIWGFSEEHLMGPAIWGLPLEEILFFVCVPYACVFTHFAIGKCWRADHWSGRTGAFTMLFIAALFAAAVIAWPRLYSCITFMLLGALLSYFAFVTEPIWLLRAFVSYAVVFPAFLLVNGILTGSVTSTPVVWYSSSHVLGYRVGTIPLEDFFYGLLLVLFTIALFERFERRRSREASSRIT